ncbi:MAG: hypothetical protein WDN03_04040 [Rhizomicrobium sp.]
MDNDDKELAAINVIVGALTDLDDEAKSRVIDYAIKRFRIATAQSEMVAPPASPLSDAETPVQGETRRGAPSIQTDIKALKEAKQPSTGVQMAVVVAYYLKEIAPATERKDAIAATDITTYFNQARFPLPTGKNGPADTLNNARAAGYFESAGRGLFKLNSVGFNLAAYNLPSDSGTRARAPKGGKKALKARK